MEMEQKLNKRFFSLGRGLRQIGCATLALIALTGPAQAATDEVVYFHTDALGSPVAAFSEAGEVCWTESYSPYGEKLDKEDSLAPADGCGLLSTDVGYTGHVQDGSGLVYAQQRYYDPQIGRFMSTDPIAASAGSPNMFGRYHYANNSPYRYTDPDGEIPLDYAVDGISVGISAAIYANEPTFWNGFTLGVDSILAAIPYVPAGIGLIRGAGKGVDAVSASTRLADTASIRFTQDTAGRVVDGRASFGDGTPIKGMIDDLRSGGLNPADVKPIRTFVENGKTYTLDNRRLLAHDLAGVKVNTRPATGAELSRERGTKFTTRNDGTIIGIRGSLQ